MKEQALMSAVFDLVEHLTKSELTNIAKTLIYNYFAGSERPTARERAREAVFRYAQCKSLPTLNDVRKKSREQLNKLEHLVLRMEYEGMRLDGSLPLFQASQDSDDKESFSPPVPAPPQSGPGPFRVESAADDDTRTAQPGHVPSPPRVRKSQLTRGSFSGVKTNSPRSRAAKPGHARTKPVKRPRKASAPREKPASNARRVMKKTSSRRTAKKPSSRKKPRR
ncbi:MAG: hypothetical protein JXD23_06130 [Spirochaetales bacterium]|nr:hypothetical protein [Spirochaetales bacterium]